MKKSFYPKLAFDSIRKNKRMYLPYILTCIGMVMMHNIICTLCEDQSLYTISGGNTIQSMMGFGKWVIAIFACIFLFYTNSFIIRRRKKEFGLYNILGMGKKNIALVQLWEVMITAAISIGAGIFLGIVLSKAAGLGMLNMLGAEINYRFEIFPEAIINTLEVFGAVFVLLFLSSLMQLRFSSASALIKSENVGEKPPKGNILFGAAGVILLCFAYYQAVTIKNPVQALMHFFIAVIMVIVATYLIMIAGSVLFCRLLQKNKKYYYRSDHFVSVSSMVYRMKRNGAGLASICILATMVLVTIVTTACLYFGSEDSLNTVYPREINIEFNSESITAISEDKIDSLEKEILEIAEKAGAKTKNVVEKRYVSVTGIVDGKTVEVNSSAAKLNDTSIYSELTIFSVIALDDYNRITGKNETLKNGEVMIYSAKKYDYDTISFNGGKTFQVKKVLDKFDEYATDPADIVPVMTLIVPNVKDAVSGLDQLTDQNEQTLLHYNFEYFFDTGLDEESQISLAKQYNDELKLINVSHDNEKFVYVNCVSKVKEKNSLLANYAGMFYLGISLSVVFLFAAVLIIYYKQISEGYEDQARFAIMQKVGMTKKEIRRSINSQLLTVFFLPLFFAGCHLCFAFPFVKKLLLLFDLTNNTLLILTTAISFLAFALIYVIVYKITSNAYYHIVSEAKEK